MLLCSRVCWLLLSCIDAAALGLLVLQQHEARLHAIVTHALGELRSMAAWLAGVADACFVVAVLEHPYVMPLAKESV